MHDQAVEGFVRAKDFVTLELENYSLNFLGVIKFEASGQLVGDLWLYNEILLPGNNGSFIINSLFEENEMTVEAKGISLILRANNQYFINDNGNPPLKTKDKIDKENKIQKRRHR
jgi:hypothetical protein